MLSSRVLRPIRPLRDCRARAGRIEGNRQLALWASLQASVASSCARSREQDGIRDCSSRIEPGSAWRFRPACSDYSGAC